MTIKEIEQICDNVRKKYNILVPIDDGYELAYQMKGHVREDASLPKETVGIIKKYKESFWITLSSSLSETQKKIAIAQLIGVFCLYTPFINKDKDWEDFSTDSIDLTHEKLLNGLYFAKEILMPRYLYEPYFCENISITHKVNLRVLSNIFNVPIELVRERGIDLNMIIPKIPDIKTPSSL